MENMSMGVRVRLSVMMFLQYMMFAVWFVPLAMYLDKMGVEGWKKAFIISSMPIGCLMSPIFCMIADRHFASQKVLIVLNFACAILFFIAAQVGSPLMLFGVLVMAMLCYMPTWSLTNAVAMANCPSEEFPRIRLFGSIGWVASTIFSFVAFKFFEMNAEGVAVPLIIDGTAIPLYCGAATGLVAGIMNLTLPNTPPPAKGKEASVMDALGLRALTLLKDSNFAVLILVSSLVMIPFTMYFSLGSQFFNSQGYNMVTARMNWGQFSEIFLMLLVPISLSRFGVKWTVVIGLGALILRYVSFLCGGVFDQPSLYYAAILIHGVIFGFIFVAGQVYVDKKAPKELRAQAQGLVGLLCFGVGWLVGNFFNVKLIDIYTTILENGDKTYDWNKIWMVTIGISVVLLVMFCAFFKDDVRTTGEVA